MPPNGLVVFCGHPDETKLILVALEPLKPIAQTLYKCDNRFHTEVLRDQLTFGDSKIGFVVIDGHACSFHLLVGNVRQTLFKLEVCLPKKHGRGGQSQNRFARIRDEKRGWYVSKVAELFTQHFMENGLLTVNSLIFAGCAGFKHDLAKKFDSRVTDKILAYVDVQYGGENGFNQAIELAANVLKDTKFVEEQRLLQSFFDLIVVDGAYCYSAQPTIDALEQGLIETLIVWEELTDIRFELVSTEDATKRKVAIKPAPSLADEKKPHVFPGYEIVAQQPLLDWIFEHHKDFGAKLKLVSSVTSIASQFINGFGGLGGIMRFKAPEQAHFEGPAGDDESAEDSEGSIYDYEY